MRNLLTENRKRYGKNSQNRVITVKLEFTKISDKRLVYPLRGRSFQGCVRWGLRDLNPHRRVSTTGGATSHEINESSLQLFIITQQTHSNHAHNWSPLVYQVSLNPQLVALRASASLLAHLCCSLSSSHFLLAPFPTLVTAFLPGA